MAIGLFLATLGPVAAQVTTSATDTVAPAVASTLTALKRDIDLRAAELAEKKSEYEALLKKVKAPAPGVAKPAAAKPAEPWNGMFERYQKQYVREGHYKWETVEKVTPKQTDPCNPQQLYIRADSLDNYLYGITPSSKAIGASLSYLNDRVAGTQTVGINGMVKVDAKIK